MSIDNNDDGLDLQYHSNYLHSNPMVIEMITGKIFKLFDEVNWEGEDPLATNSLVSRINLGAIIEKNKLDLKQAAAFEILACSFILNSLDDYKVTEDELSKLFCYNDFTRADKTAKLAQLMDMLVTKGGAKDLVMLLSGMGGSGKAQSSRPSTNLLSMSPTF